MLNKGDIAMLAQKGITEKQIADQLDSFKKGFPYLRLQAAASTERGIKLFATHEMEPYMAAWDEYRNSGKKVQKFVPASGAATRMFKDLFAFLSADYPVPTTDFEKKFFENIDHFAFYDDLNEACIRNEKSSVNELMARGSYKAVVTNLLNSSGLNYGALPKGLLKFHRYDNDARTPMEEHLVEGALYAAGADGKVHLHFTVSADHLQSFKQLLQKRVNLYAQQFGVTYEVSFSVQKSSTDTIAADMNNEPFRESGKLLFRPGGHGALIENLNDLDADILFIKNIDNVVPDRLKADTVTYKKLLAGLLVTLQARAFDYLRLLDTGQYTHDQIEEIIRFLQNDLCCRNPHLKDMEDGDLVLYLRRKLNRPMRVCGMVKNVGEPGGGPFLVENKDGSVSLQILESSQINMEDNASRAMFTGGTHFNPVDLVCAIRDYKGQKFNLLQYVDPATGFISHKSKNGKDLKALELPGLWNGAMSDWNTLFVEVPLSTFNPVKTVNDLLRTQHQ